FPFRRNVQRSSRPRRRRGRALPPDLHDAALLDHHGRGHHRQCLLAFLSRLAAALPQRRPEVLAAHFTVFFVAAARGHRVGGCAAGRVTSAGWWVPRSRSLVLLGGSLLCLLSTPAALLLDPWITVPLMYVVAAGSMAGFPIFFALSQDISPRHASL